MKKALSSLTLLLVLAPTIIAQPNCDEVIKINPFAKEKFCKRPILAASWIAKNHLVKEMNDRFGSGKEKEFMEHIQSCIHQHMTSILKQSTRPEKNNNNKLIESFYNTHKIAYESHSTDELKEKYLQEISGAQNIFPNTWKYFNKN